MFEFKEGRVYGVFRTRFIFDLASTGTSSYNSTHLTQVAIPEKSDIYMSMVADTTLLSGSAALDVNLIKTNK